MYQRADVETEATPPGSLNCLIEEPTACQSQQILASSITKGQLKKWTCTTEIYGQTLAVFMTSASLRVEKRSSFGFRF